MYARLDYMLTNKYEQKAPNPLNCMSFILHLERKSWVLIFRLSENWESLSLSRVQNVNLHNYASGELSWVGQVSMKHPKFSFASCSWRVKDGWPFSSVLETRTIKIHLIKATWSEYCNKPVCRNNIFLGEKERMFLDTPCSKKHPWCVQETHFHPPPSFMTPL